MHLKQPFSADEMTESREHRSRLLPGGGITQAQTESLLDKETWLPVYSRLKEIARSTQLEMSFHSLGREVSK